MINEFGVPMNEMEIANSNIKPHERMLANSGLEMQFWGGLVGAVVGSMFGRRSSTSNTYINNQQETKWEETQQYKDFQAQNKQLTGQITGLQSSLANLNTSFNQQQELAKQRADMNQSTINDLSSKLGEYKSAQAERQAGIDAANSYMVTSERNKGVKVNRGENLGKKGDIKPTTRSYFNRDSMRIGGLTDQSVNV